MPIGSIIYATSWSLKCLCCFDSSNHYRGVWYIVFSNGFDAENGLAQIEALRFLESLKPISSAVSYVTLSFLTIYAVFLIGIELAKLNKISGVFPGIIAVMSYLSVNPMIFEFLHEDATVVAENVLAKQYTDTKGLF